MGLLNTARRQGLAEADGVQVYFAASSGEVLGFAAGELAAGLERALGETATVAGSYELEGPQLLLALGKMERLARAELRGDAYSIEPVASGLAIRGGSDRAVLHGVYRLFEEVGARFPLGRGAEFPRVDRFKMLSAGPVKSEPAFQRRALVSDIMTWNYTFAERLALHLRHDREFIPWMARNALNGFFYIRHAHDTRYRIEELVKPLSERGIEAEYGGHVTQQLLPRESFDGSPEFFPEGADGARHPSGNVCVSNAEAMSLVTANAIDYALLNPDSEIVHVWGADVRDGAWCRCSQCSALSPQLQYMKMINAIADGIASAESREHLKVTYLAYHDTLKPDPKLRPHHNVWFEWAPRERCYRHAIDDHRCRVNPPLFESLKRYVELFDGRGHIFEYYADAILFSGLCFATPTVVSRDLKAYHSLGIRSISCLTFGAYSTIAYPANLVTFARCSRDLNSDPEQALGDSAAQRYPNCAAEMSAAYVAIARASSMVLNYGDVLRPFMSGRAAEEKREELAQAVALFDEALAATEQIGANHQAVSDERELWHYSVESLRGIRGFLAARAETEGSRTAAAEREALEQLKSAISHVHAISEEAKGTWGTYDIEWLHQLWIAGMREKISD